FNLNIPYLHEVTTKIKWVIAHIFFTSPCVRQHRGGLIFYAGDHPRKPEQPLICQPFFDCGVTIMQTITIINPNVKFYIRMICQGNGIEKALSVERA
ncbi:hypothetical protein OXU90_16910, partial [Escherichia coli]